MKGASILETVLYIAIFAVITLLTVNTVLTFTRAVGEIRDMRHTIRESVIAMERMLREIRAANSIDIANSVLGTSPGTLALLGTPDNFTFSLQSGKLFLKKNAAPASAMTNSSVNITNLVFTRFVIINAEAVRIQMTMDNKNFYGTAILRQIYK
ncbi:MAG: hypothetical protein AAB604_03150 [Patescibacteria group bacterium]